MRPPKLGQHFLTDNDTLQRIVAHIRPQAQERFVEIGPGKGQLTRPLLASGAQVWAIEKDTDLAGTLSARLGEFQNMLTVTQGDAARNLPLPPNGAWRAVGNLPYAISSPVLIALPAYLPRLADAHFMLQKEFALRLAAQPGSRTYGRISVAVQAFFTVDTLFEVSAASFTPMPKVASMMTRLQPLKRPKTITDHKVFSKVVRQAFAQRRKQLANALATLPVSLPDNIGGLRAEMLGVDEFISIANLLAKNSK